MESKPSFFSFIEDTPRNEHDSTRLEDKSAEHPWKVLSVEDDLVYQASVVHCLKGLVVLGQPIQLLTANSAAQAAMVLAANPDIGLVLLDVMMEEEDAGLQLVETIRNTLGNHKVRIVLLTGQPGLAPRAKIVSEYDINEYWDKSDLHDRLPSIVTTNLRVWQSLSELEQAHLGLQMVVEACQHIAFSHNLQEFIDIVLQQIANVIGLDHSACEGIICLSQPEDEPANLTVLSSFGFFSDLLKHGQNDFKAILNSYSPQLEKLRTTHTHQFHDDIVILCFPQTENVTDLDKKIIHIVLLKTSSPLSQSAIHLLSVFSENVRSGFTNLMLVDRLRTLSYFDPSLKIYNKNWMIREISKLSPRQRSTSTLYLFSVNDFVERALTFGQAAVEQLMLKIKEHLSKYFNAGTPFARIGQDTIAVLCKPESLPDEALLQSLTSIDLPIETTSRKISLTQVVFNLAAIDCDYAAEEVLHLARTVLYTARHEGKKLVTYQPELLTRIQKDYVLLYELIQALEDGQITIYLQPKFQLRDGKVAGFEALARWKKQDGSFVSPGDFIPVAETSGLINSLDLQVLKQATAAAKQLFALGYALPISFNATWSDLCNPEYTNQLLSAVDDTQLPAHLLEVEITESQAMKGFNDVAPFLEKLRQRGVSVSIDDFGTGHSALAYLSKLPADTIKIDRSFIRELGSNSIGAHVAEVIIALGAKFNFSVIAEGIETETQKDHLLQMGCTLGQGFLFAKPMPIDQVVEWMQHQ